MEKSTYRIADWDRIFENNESRKLKRMTWVKVPNTHDTAGFNRVMRQPNGGLIYCAFILMVQVASKMPVRGVLANDTGPLDADDLSHRTGLPAEHFTVAFGVLTEKKIGWLLKSGDSPEASGSSGEEGKGIREEGNKNTPPTPPRGADEDLTVRVRRENFVTQEWRITSQSRVSRLALQFAALGTNSDEIQARRRRMVAMWPKADTPESLLKHWGKFAADDQQTSIPGQPSRREQAEMEAEFARQRPGVAEKKGTDHAR